MQKDNAVVVLGRIQVQVRHCLELARQLGDLEVVGGEQSKGAHAVCQVIGTGPGQGQAVEGAGAATDFVQQHQTALGGVVQNIGGLRHLHHKGGAAAGQV